MASKKMCQQIIIELLGMFSGPWVWKDLNKEKNVKQN